MGVGEGEGEGNARPQLVHKKTRRDGDWDRNRGSADE